jgi:hypothetical protein
MSARLRSTRRSTAGVCLTMSPAYRDRDNGSTYTMTVTPPSFFDSVVVYSQPPPYLDICNSREPFEAPPAPKALTNNIHPQQQSPFFNKLPGEVRNQIYKYVFEPEPLITPDDDNGDHVPGCLLRRDMISLPSGHDGTRIELSFVYLSETATREPKAADPTTGSFPSEHSFLYTCRKINEEAKDMPATLTTLTFWVARPNQVPCFETGETHHMVGDEVNCLWPRPLLQPQLYCTTPVHKWSERNRGLVREIRVLLFRTFKEPCRWCCRCHHYRDVDLGMEKHFAMLGRYMQDKGIRGIQTVEVSVSCDMMDEDEFWDSLGKFLTVIGGNTANLDLHHRIKKVVLTILIPELYQNWLEEWDGEDEEMVRDLLEEVDETYVRDHIKIGNGANIKLLTRRKLETGWIKPILRRAKERMDYALERYPIVEVIYT